MIGNTFRSFQNDMDFGLKKEIEVLDLITATFALALLREPFLL